MLAILLDALDCIDRFRDARDPRQRALFEEAEAWILGPAPHVPGGRKELISFEYVCEVLSLDQDAVRGHVRRQRSAAGTKACASSGAAVKCADLPQQGNVV